MVREEVQPAAALEAAGMIVQSVGGDPINECLLMLHTWFSGVNLREFGFQM